MIWQRLSLLILKILFPLATVYIRQSCECGPHLDPIKMRRLSSSFGPGPISRVLRDVVQGLVDAATQTKQTFSVLRTRQGDGDVVIRGTILSYN